MRRTWGSRHTRAEGPAVTVHQPSIRAREAAHDVVFDRRRSSDRRGGASQSVSRSCATIHHPENARTGTGAVRPTRRSRRVPPRLHRNTGWLEAGVPGPAPTAELVVVEVVAPHDVEPDQQAPRQRDLRFGPAAAPEDREVDALELGIASGRQRSGRAEPPAHEGAALLADVSQAVLVRGSVDGGRQPDIADDVLTAGESGHGAEHQDGGQGGEGTDAGMSHEVGGRCDRRPRR